MKYKDGIKAWLNNRKITDTILEKFNITFETNITIPIYDKDGFFSYNKYRRNPLIPETGPKYWYDKGGKAELFGAHFVKDEKIVVITEGELDALCLWSQNIPAVSSTGGCMTFKEEWVNILKDKQVYICYDNDLAGYTGAVKTLQFIPHAKVILIPHEAGIKDITDYCIRGNDFRDLMLSAKHYNDIDKVREERSIEKSQMRSFLFYDIWIENYESIIERELIKKNYIKNNPKDNINLSEIKKIPINSIIKVKNDKALCLWHNEKTPSMHVYGDHFYCFSCGKHGDVIDVVMEKEKVDFNGAIEWLKNNR